MEANALLPILTAIAGSYLTYFFASRSKREEYILKYKEEKYANLLVLLQGFVGVTATSETKRKFFEEQYKSWIYSSDEVIEAINEMVKLVIDSRKNTPDPQKGRKVIGNIVLAMRKDLNGKTKLKYSDFVYTDVR
ncbi:MAG: hypothetical protein A2525_09090 [Sulfurimonas sp. RIFOXYD12_FULL_36_11]|jgi:hypothetical protein|uniref:hypothetical protein n=1 Tax=unclassified Sulfurimonas TaxID=2623549 RepID=UPI0008B396FE|nr:MULTISPECIES: hypothetical protein [unclassified Sulfurimonas]MDD3855310.1 hypothetical protein [Sulfurimonas sp.]OHE06256.1 MAG: hypothetical protein A2345_08195 [Sulfurimonas sp. RIFOXYB12_FULL_35_9]OHE12034.1 MAG: hypothetical protein A2525_09090 [Sulfurimonas sp. RIFOXYD12_FULL_36_11]OHE16129.1 MAG: hypothetical protein A2329_08655 [Sulfurimonas sp. RIFOXYB2_FULL_37_5]